MRGLDRHMPAFGDALLAGRDRARGRRTSARSAGDRLAAGRSESAARVLHRKGLPRERGGLDDGDHGRASASVENDLIYERRIGARNQIELVVADRAAGRRGEWSRGLGDVASRSSGRLHASMRAGRSAPPAWRSSCRPATSPRSRQRLHRVRAVRHVGSAAAAEQLLQLHAGVELPSDGARAPGKSFLRRRSGPRGRRSGFGRAWSPQIEVLWARPEGGRRNGTSCRSCRSRCRSCST